MLNDRVVFVSGASRGIGAATARCLAARGAAVAVNYHRSREQAMAVVADIEQAGGFAMGVAGDMRDADAVRAAVSEVEARMGAIDTLVLNAHMDCPIARFIDQDWAEFSAKMTHEMQAMFFLCQAVVPGMIERRSGSIVAISSMGARKSVPGFAAQCAAKAAMESLIRSLAVELGPHGVRVNCVQPGFIETDLTAIFSHEQKCEIAERTALLRNGQPDDVGRVVAFLASEASGFMTGACLPVNGGEHMM